MCPILISLKWQNFQHFFKNLGLNFIEFLFSEPVQVTSQLFHWPISCEDFSIVINILMVQHTQNYVPLLWKFSHTNSPMKFFFRELTFDIWYKRKGRLGRLLVWCLQFLFSFKNTDGLLESKRSAILLQTNTR